MKAWKRILTVILRSSILKKRYVFGAESNFGRNDFAISCSIHKYLSTLEDQALIKIDNLPLSVVAEIMLNEFYNVEIWCGYETSGAQKVFDGGVIHISNTLNGLDRTSTINILCASNLIAKYYQNKLNLTFNSGVNLWSMTKFICERAGIPNTNVGLSLKKDFIDKVTSINGSAGDWLTSLSADNSSFISDSDSVLDSTFSVFDANLENQRVITLHKDNIMLTNGYPTANTDGVTITLLPSFAFKVGDVIKIDNALIDISVTEKSQMSAAYSNILSPSGSYMIYQIDYNLNNRSDNFDLTIKAKNRERISTYIGGK